MGSNLKTFMAAARPIKRRKNAKDTKRDEDVQLMWDTFLEGGVFRAAPGH